MFAKECLGSGVPSLRSVSAAVCYQRLPEERHIRSGFAHDRNLSATVT